MGIMKIFGRGFGTTAQKGRMVIYLWLVYILFAVLVVAPFYYLLQHDFSRSLLGERLFQGTDLLWLGDLVFKYQNITPLLSGGLLVPFILFLVLQVFLNGGIIGRIAATEGWVTLQGFWGDSGKYFGRLLRVFLLSFLCYALIFGLLGRLIAAPFRLWSKNASTAWTPLISSSLRLLVFLLKIRLVAEDSRKAIRSTRTNFAFLGRRFFKAWILFLIVGLVFVALTAVYLIGARYLPKSGLVPGVIFFLWQQVYILGRLWTTVLFFSTEYHFWKSFQTLPS
jgi:hypothetical protein